MAQRGGVLLAAAASSPPAPLLQAAARGRALPSNEVRIAVTKPNLLDGG